MRLFKLNSLILDFFFGANGVSAEFSLNLNCACYLKMVRILNILFQEKDIFIK